MSTARWLWLLLALIAAAPGSAWAEGAGDYKAEYRQALAAYEAGDNAGYLSHLQEMARLMPLMGASSTDDANRPFLQYHLARALALAGQPEAALAQLGQILDEGIEGLLISQGVSDQAFESLWGTRGWKQLTRRMEQAPITVQGITGPLYRIEGAGCTLLASVGPDGVLLVDTGYAPAAKGVAKALREAGGKELRFIINTHSHDDHVGGNAALKGGAAIIAHPATRAGMIDREPFIDQPPPPFPAGALPTVVSAAPMSVFFNLEEIRIIPLPGHTEGDVIVYFTQSHVLHMGDRYFPNPVRPTWPWPGQDVRAYMATMIPLLESLPPEGVVLSGHSPTVSFSHLRTSVESLQRAVAFVEEAQADGLSLEQVKAQGLPSEWSTWTNGRQEVWLDHLYKSLSSAEGSGG